MDVAVALGVGAMVGLGTNVVTDVAAAVGIGTVAFAPVIDVVVPWFEGWPPHPPTTIVTRSNAHRRFTRPPTRSARLTQTRNAHEATA